MATELFERALNLAERSKAPEIRLLGGEPTLHPQFIAFATKALERGLKVLVFSNGLIPPKPLEFLSGCTKKQVGILINVNDESTYKPTEYKKLTSRLAALGDKVTCGYNISGPNFDLSPLARLISEHGLYPSIRLGLTHPILSSQNQFAAWTDVPAIARQVIDAARNLESRDIILGLDCGFTLCMFRDYYAELISLRINYKFCCKPVIDLTPDGKMWYCLALWGHENHYDIDSFQTLDGFRDAYEEQFRFIHGVGLLSDCPDCKFRKAGRCSGGCLSRILRQWK